MQMQTFLTGLCKVFDTQVTIKDRIFLIVSPARFSGGDI